jgi:predicted transcriptional regulator of viral defense system
MPGKYWGAVMDVAVDNGGYVTPALMTPFGVPAVELRKMVSRGTLESAGHGIYRVPHLPIDHHDEFIRARLWAMGRGVVSHESALLLHDLCDVNPTTVHVTIPNSYQIRRSGGELHTVHHADLDEGEVTRLGAVVVTTVRRTLDDVVGTTPAYLVRQAVETARRRGAITAAEHRRFVEAVEAERA